MLIWFAFVGRIIRAFPTRPDQSFLQLFLTQNFFQFLNIFDMARLICNSLRAFILPRLTKFSHQWKQSIFSKQQLKLFSQFSLLTVLVLITLQGLFQVTVPPHSLSFSHHDVIFYVKILNDDEFISPLLKYFIGFLLGFWFYVGFTDFEYLKRHQIAFYVSSKAKKGTNYELWVVIIQIRTSKR